MGDRLLADESQTRQVQQARQRFSEVLLAGLDLDGFEVPPPCAGSFSLGAELFRRMNDG